MQYLIELKKLQGEKGLRLANKLRSAHINWKQQKMKVNLAAQALSSSVANALEFCEGKLKLPQFQVCGPTGSLFVFLTVFLILSIPEIRLPEISKRPSGNRIGHIHNDVIGSSEEKFFLVLVLLRLGLLEDLAFRACISQSNLSRIIFTWLDFLHAKLRSLRIRPSRSSVNKTMPSAFKQIYPMTRVIIDCSEIFIEFLFKKNTNCLPCC